MLPLKTRKIQGSLSCLDLPARDRIRHALLVNPYDAESVAGAIAQALAMPLEERRARHQALLAVVSNYDVDRWQREFLTALSRDDNAPSEHRDVLVTARSHVTSLANSHPKRTREQATHGYTLPIATS